ncbi:hypothetical protein XELAEV_18004693mg [Xenopus laevis]|uniref:Uncharacterized protein n=1 Tax=Xenopus laevis TaxID=8355 RepID=A0A974GZP5_XENLA|nr:hypothetical protein XELAEV_18004693mg [Xenopus laevis]
MERSIRRNHLEGIAVEEWRDSKSLMKIIEAKEEIEVIGGLTVEECEKVWSWVNEKSLINRQKDLARMAVHGCLPTREFQRKRRLIEICERERGVGGMKIFLMCFGNVCTQKKLKGVQLLTFNMMLYGLCDIDKKPSQILWLIVNCIKEVLWDIRNI